MTAFRFGVATRAITTWLPSTCQAWPLLTRLETFSANHRSCPSPIMRREGSFHLAAKAAMSGLPSTIGRSTS
jgi:hypothetical protein